MVALGEATLEFNQTQSGQPRYLQGFGGDTSNAAHAATRAGAHSAFPGCEHAHAPDVMRGEEVQILGALELTVLRDGLFVLPGTHSKWAQVQNGRVTEFRTCVTGDFYALLSQHSILAKTVAHDEPLIGV